MSTAEAGQVLNEGFRSTDAVAYAQAAQESYADASKAVGQIDRCYCIAGYKIALSMAGDALCPHITPAFEHLRNESQQVPDLTICLFDTVTTGKEVPPPPWNFSDYLARGEIRGYNDGRICTAYKHGSRAVSLLDLGLNRAVFWMRDAAQLPYWERGAPLLNILHWWLGHNHRLLIHAAAVGDEHGAALIVGRQGSGKSTTALSCVAAGLKYLGDDYTVVSSEPRVVHSLYNTAKLDGSHLARFPQFLSYISNAGRLDMEKALLFLHNYLPQQIARALPVRAILVPRVTGREVTRIQKVSPATALAALAPSTIFQLPRAGADTFKYLASFVSKVPCYSLQCGTDLSQLAAVVRGLLSESSS